MGKANLKFNKKALSPIFATLIILAVVTVLFIPVFIWATSMTSQTQDSWQQSGVTATERIVIEEVSLVGNPTLPAKQSCTIYVRNIGETSVTINNVLISKNGANSQIQAYQKLPVPTDPPQPPPTPTPTPIPQQMSTVIPNTNTILTSIVKGDLIEIKIPNVSCMSPTFTLENGATYTIKVFTTRGVSDTYQSVAIWPT